MQWVTHLKPPPDIEAPVWIEVRLSAPPAQAEAAADFLAALSGQGVQLGEDEQRPQLRVVRAYLTQDAGLAGHREQIETYVAQLVEFCPKGEVDLAFAELPPEDWSAAWKQHFHPRLVSRRIIVAPPWELGQPRGEQEMVIIDPGQAFGTGQHQSTQLVLRVCEHLADEDGMPARVLDVGCGSGILALAALKLGAQSALGIDIDPLAVEASQYNAGLNGLADRLEAAMTPLTELKESFPLVLANITDQDLIDLAAPLSGSLARGGQLVLSGFLVKQAAKVQAAFEAQGLVLLESDSLAGWAALVMT